MKSATAAKMTSAGHEADVESTRNALADYLHRLGVSDRGLRDALVTECLKRAGSRVAPGLHDELLRRSIEEAQRRMDSALARLLGLSVTRDLHTIAGARAALLMCSKRASTDFLFDDRLHEPERAFRLKAILPMATPPESPRTMAPQKLEFFLFKSA